jgi:hypothetical protein
MLAAVELADDLRRIAEAAVGLAEPAEELAGIVPAEPAAGLRLYLVAYRREDGDDAEATPTWLVLDDRGRVVDDRATVRDAVSIVTMCELAEDAAGGGDLDDLRSRLVALRLTEDPPGIDEADQAVLDLQATIGAGPTVASPARLDAVGEATRKLEQALGEGPGSPFVEAMKAATGTVDALVRDVEARYKRPLQ